MNRRHFIWLFKWKVCIYQAAVNCDFDNDVKSFATYLLFNEFNSDLMTLNLNYSKFILLNVTIKKN